MKALKSFMVTLAIILLIGVIFLFGKSSIKKDIDNTETTFHQKTKANPVTKAVVEKTMDAYIESSDGKAKEIAESMSEEDKDAVAEIIANNVSLSSLSDIQSIVSSGDADAALEYAQDNLSDEEFSELEEIMSKYAEP